MKMKFTNWRQSKNVEAKFRRYLNRISDMLVRNTKGLEDPLLMYNTMLKIQNSRQYKEYVDYAVRNMVNGIATQNVRTWREAAKKATKGYKVFTALQQELANGLNVAIEQQVEENSKLIRTLPTDTAEKVVKNITAMSYKGMRASEIAKVIQKETKKHSRASAKLIARTEVSKSTTALTKARSEELDIHWYIWRTALDGDRVRKSHRNMEGVLVNWDDPPSPEALVGEKSVGNYHAGNIWNCRCYPEPVVDPDFLPNRVKVYHNGQIEAMGKTQFITRFIK